MTLLYKMILIAFLPIFLLSIVFFVLVLELVELFANLWRYLNYDVPVTEIIKVLVLYLPKCISYSIPIGFLFAVSYTLGNFYANNELIAVFGSGIKLFRFVFPLILFSIILSGLWFYFEEKVVIDTFEMKNELSKNLLKQKSSLSNTNVTVLTPDSSVIYFAEYYNDSNLSLANVTVIELDEENRFERRIEAEKAVWKDVSWEFQQARMFAWTGENPQDPYITETYMNTFTEPIFNQKPSAFRKAVRNIEEMHYLEAKEWVDSLRTSGLPFRGALTEYYNRFSFALTPFIVALISAAIGGRLKKNILLMSLLISLIIVVVYYVMQMVFILFAKQGYLPPIAGAWGTFLIFLVVGFWLFKNART